MNGQPEAIRLAQALEYCDASVARQAINELRRMHAENASLSTGYDAARLEIKSLQAELVKESARTAAEKLRADQMTTQHRMQCNLRRELEEMLAAVGAGGVEPLRKADHFRDATQMVSTQAAPESLAEPGWGGEWVTVPACPTLAMCEASGFDVSESRTAYARMLAAAPQPPADHLRDAAKMTLDEAIKHAEEVAGCTGAQCGVEHAQLAAWLRELRDRRVAEMASHDHLRDATEMIGANEAPARKPLTDRQIQDIWCSARNEGNQTGYS